MELNANSLEGGPVAMNVTVTEAALSKIKEVSAAEKKTDYAMRIGVRGGGCSGLSYTIDFDNETREGDQIFDIDGVKFVIDAKSYLYLSGIELDFVDGLQGKGFTFKNPNATNTCGCGMSFS